VPVFVTRSGFVCDSATETYSYEWSDIVEIRAFKLDLFSYDEVRFAISLRNGTFVELSEERPGFYAFLEALKLRFPTVEGWEQQVMHPAFAANETVLYHGP
jgi:hypothetical protein